MDSRFPGVARVVRQFWRPIKDEIIQDRKNTASGFLWIFDNKIQKIFSFF